MNETTRCLWPFSMGTMMIMLVLESQCFFFVPREEGRAKVDDEEAYKASTHVDVGWYFIYMSSLVQQHSTTHTLAFMIHNIN